MCAHEAYEDVSVIIIDFDDQSIGIAFDVEHNAVIC